MDRLEKPETGTITIDGETQDLAHIHGKDLTELRKKTGMVFQNFNLFSKKTALQNVMEGLSVVKTVSYTHLSTRKTGFFLEFFIFQTEPFRWKTAFIIQGIFFFLRLDTVTTAVGWKNNESDICFGKTFLAWNEFRKDQNTGCLLYTSLEEWQKS